MRKAFVGMSTPICYDYNFEHVLDNYSESPNPILDSPMGLFLLYDEIWFLSKNVCPFNCRNLPYVKFLADEYDLTMLDLNRFGWGEVELEKHFPKEDAQINWNMWKSSVRLNLDYDLFVQLETRGIDNHSRMFFLGKTKQTPKPDPRNLLIDDFIATHYKLELITNSMTSSCLNAVSSTSVDQHAKLALTQNLICNNIPNFQLKDGPYHSFIEDLRSEELLKNFRKKIASAIEENPHYDIGELKKELESAMDKYLNELILKHISKKEIYKSAASTIIGQVPVLSNIYGGIEGGVKIYNTIKDRKQLGWMGFIAKSRLLQD